MSAAKTFAVVDAALDLVSEIAKKMGASPGEWGWHFQRYRAFAKALFERSPIKKGARVRLTKTPIINAERAWGWLGSKHFLVDRAAAIVDDVDFHEGKFSAALLFDEESYISPCGANKGQAIKVAPEKRHQYWFSESDFAIMAEDNGP